MPNESRLGTSPASSPMPRHKELMKIVDAARAGDWGQAERMAYEFREAYPFFK